MEGGLLVITGNFIHFLVYEWLQSTQPDSEMGTSPAEVACISTAIPVDYPGPPPTQQDAQPQNQPGPYQPQPGLGERSIQTYMSQIGAHFGPVVSVVC